MVVKYNHMVNAALRPAPASGPLPPPAGTPDAALSGSPPPDFIPCYVINLDAAPERREAMARQAQRLGVPFSFRKATDGRRIAPERRHIVADDARALHEYGPLSAAEVGCALSHVAIYLEMIEHGIPHAVILEDDVHLASDFARLIDRNDPASLPRQVSAQSAAMVQLTHVRRVYRYGARPAAGGRRIMRPHSSVWLASAYFITLEAARRMAQALYPVWTVADHWDMFQRRGLVKLHALVPNCAWESTHSAQSAISPQRQPRKRRRRPLADRLAGWVDDLVTRPLLVRRTAPFRERDGA